MSRTTLGILLVASGAALFGTLSYIARGAAATGLDAIPFVAWRAMVATVALLAAAVVVDSSGSRFPRISTLREDRRVALIAAGLAGAILNLAMFAALLRMEIAVALICFYTYPALVTLAAVPLYGERLDRVRGAALLVACLGLALVVLAPLGGATRIAIDPIGVALALLAAVCQATFILISGRGWKPMPNLHVATVVVAMAVVLSLPLAFVAGQASGLFAPFRNPSTWIWILAGGITGAAIPTTAFITGIGLIGPSRAAILMTIEPLVGVTLAALLLGEQPSALQLAGGAAVLLAAAVLQVAPRTAGVPVPEAELGPLV